MGRYLTGRLNIVKMGILLKLIYSNTTQIYQLNYYFKKISAAIYLFIYFCQEFKS